MKTTHEKVEPGSKMGKLVAIRYFIEGTDVIAPKGGRPCPVGEVAAFSKEITPEEKDEFGRDAAEALGVVLA